MKALVFGFAAIIASATVKAQGTVAFVNITPGYTVNAPVYMSDGVTKLSGSQFMAELLGGPSPTSLSFIAATGFLTGNGAGYFNGETQTIPGVDVGNTAWVIVQVWNTTSGASFDQAKASGLPDSWWASTEFSVMAGGGTINPSSPAPLTGLGTSPVFLNGAVPEPSTLALAGLGIASVIAALQFRRRAANKSV